MDTIFKVLCQRYYLHFCTHFPLHFQKTTLILSSCFFGWVFVFGSRNQNLYNFQNKKKRGKKAGQKRYALCCPHDSLDILAPIFMMKGLSLTRSENASLLGNFEIVATSLIAFFIFREKISPKTTFAILLITISSIMLTYSKSDSFSLDKGSLLIILATCFWGLENNCTRNLSSKDPMETVAVKGLCCGTGGIVLAFVSGETTSKPILIIPALILGFFSYGMSIFFYIYAQRFIGAAKTSAYYSLSPFIGVALAGIIFREMPAPQFFIALFFMAAGTILITYDSLQSSRKSLR